MATTKTIHFNEFWSALKRIASAKGYGVGTFMERAGIPRQRYSEFSNGSRNITARYFFKMIRGLDVSTQKVEEVANRRLSGEQNEKVAIEGFIDSNTALIKYLYKNPAVVKLLKLQADKQG